MVTSQPLQTTEKATVQMSQRTFFGFRAENRQAINAIIRSNLGINKGKCLQLKDKLITNHQYTIKHGTMIFHKDLDSLVSRKL